MRFRKRELVITAMAAMAVFASTLPAADVDYVQPTAKDKCPVCGMFVAKYPDWIAQIIYSDGQVVFFDGAKDLFKYYFNISRYHPQRDNSQIDTIYVTGYYDVRPINAASAFYVLGSDVYGPMGRELIPLQSAADASEFLRDHRGKSIIRFEDVTPELIGSLD